MQLTPLNLLNLAGPSGLETKTLLLVIPSSYIFQEIAVKDFFCLL